MTINGQSAPTVSAGLTGISESTARLADHILANPGDLCRVVDTSQSINTQFSDLIYAAERVAEGYEKLRKQPARRKRLPIGLAAIFPTGATSQSPKIRPALYRICPSSILPGRFLADFCCGGVESSKKCPILRLCNLLLYFRRQNRITIKKS